MSSSASNPTQESPHCYAKAEALRHASLDPDIINLPEDVRALLPCGAKRILHINGNAQGSNSKQRQTAKDTFTIAGVPGYKVVCDNPYNENPLDTPDALVLRRHRHIRVMNLEQLLSQEGNESYLDKVILEARKEQNYQDTCALEQAASKTRQQPLAPRGIDPTWADAPAMQSATLHLLRHEPDLMNDALGYAPLRVRTQDDLEAAIVQLLNDDTVGKREALDRMGLPLCPEEPLDFT